MHPLPQHLSKKIHEDAVAASRDYLQSEGKLIELLQRADQHKVYLEYDCSSLFQYVVKRLRLSESVAYNLITVARKAIEVPALKTKIEQREITLSNARKIAPVLTSENQTLWLTKASQLSQRELEKEIVKIRPQAATPERITYVTEARIKLELGLSENEMLKLRRVQDLISQNMSKATTLEDTISAMTAEFLRRWDPVARAKRIKDKQKPVSLQAELSQKVGVASNSSHPRNHEHPPTRALRPAHEHPPTRGRRQSVPASILHEVNSRDQGQCTFIDSEGTRCRQQRWIEIHHQVPISSGGTNTVDNLTTLCSAHHRWTHLKH